MRTAIVLTLLAILTAAAVFVKAGWTEHGRVHDPPRTQQTTSDPDDIPQLGGFQ